MSSREHVIHIVYEELVKILGGSRELQIKKQIIMMVGLYGQGKTTTCGKLATFFKKKGLRPVLIAGDVHRPAAYEQLKQIADQVKVPFYGDKKEKDAIKVVKEGLNKFKRTSDVIIVDTSGRHKLEKDLIDEMKGIFKTTKPDEKLLVIDAATGQQAGPQAKAFHDAVDITGIVLTKLDGTAKGGGALSAASEVGAPIVFIGTGEHAGDFEKFDPAGFVSRLLGMGDIKSLLEKAEESLKGKDAQKTATRIMSGKFTLHDMYDQMDMLKGMGSLRKVAEMLPGGFPGKGRIKDEDMDSTEDKLAKFKVIMDSMTDEEMNDPSIIRASRIKRIARGAGVENKNVKELLKYYNVMKRTMKGISGNRKMRKNLMKQLQFGK
jgi:signal recognition particle subunit SRP54